MVQRVHQVFRQLIEQYLASGEEGLNPVQLNDRLRPTEEVLPALFLHSSFGLAGAPQRVKSIVLQSLEYTDTLWLSLPARTTNLRAKLKPWKCWPSLLLQL